MVNHFILILCSLGQILWDFEELKMEFNYNCRKVVVRGLKNAAVHWMEGRTMLSTLKSAPIPQIFAIHV